ncbi:Uncharacterised protein [Vibrio cholerae]|nr:Uncharacterised protein [Vibrio cholerae]
MALLIQRIVRAKTGARWRSSSVSKLLRELMARPSNSRTVATPTISISMHKSSTI